MENFIYDRSTKVIFGKGTENTVGEEVKKFGNTVLLHYGGGSIKKSGLYDKVIKSLQKSDIKIIELGGVKPNPGYDLIHQGIKLCRDNSVDVVLAVGGGSTIDSAKGIAVGVPYDGDVLDFATKKATPAEALPVGVILTLPAAGSETSQYAVATYDDNGYPMKRDVVWNNNQVIRPQFAIMNPVHTTNFIPEINEKNCNGCGRCVSVCPVEAMTLVSANDNEKPKMKKAKLDEKICLGCGVCVRSCNKNSIHLKSRPIRVITPKDGVHKVVVMAIERGKLQNLFFDNRVLWSHRALAAVFGVIFKLPPIKQTLANKQVKSRYLEKMLSYSKM